MGKGTNLHRDLWKFSKKKQDAFDHEICQILTMAQLSDILPIIGDTHGSSTCHSIKEVTLHRVVVQWTIDVDGTNRGPIQALGIQILFLTQPKKEKKTTCKKNNTPVKTNMTLENPDFQYEIHLQIVEFPLSC